MSDGRALADIERQSERINKAVVLVSGGMDSVTLLHQVRCGWGIPEVFVLTFAYGQRHRREIEMARWQAQKLDAVEHRIVDLSAYAHLIGAGCPLTEPHMPVPSLDDIPLSRRHHPPTYVPNRNLVLLALGAAYAETRGARDLFYGAQAQDTYSYWDCSAEFVQRLNALLALNREQPVRVHAPFARLRKVDILRIGRQLGVDYDHTWTCYRGEEHPCGVCPSCVERDQAFQELEVDAPRIPSP